MKIRRGISHMKQISYLVPRVRLQFSRRDINIPNRPARTILFATTFVPCLSPKPFVGSHCLARPDTTNPVQEINSRPLTRIVAHQPGIECKRAFSPTSPCKKRLKGGCQVLCRNERGIQLHGVTPRDRKGPRIGRVVTEGMLEGPTRIHFVCLDQFLEGVDLGQTGKYGLYVV